MSLQLSDAACSKPNPPLHVPSCRTASGNFNYIAPGSSSAHNTASDDNCELDLGQGPQHNRPLHPNSRVQIFYQNLKRPFGSTFNGNQSAAGSEDITNSSRQVGHTAVINLTRLRKADGENLVYA
eukprot:1152538-Pelagomonas_calceolata.AAC.3